MLYYACIGNRVRVFRKQFLTNLEQLVLKKPLKSEFAEGFSVAY